MRVSTTSGRRRVTTTSGFFLVITGRPPHSEGRLGRPTDDRLHRPLTATTPERDHNGTAQTTSPTSLARPRGKHNGRSDTPFGREPMDAMPMPCQTPPQRRARTSKGRATGWSATAAMLVALATATPAGAAEAMGVGPVSQTAYPAVRQPQGRPCEPARRALEGPSHQLGLQRSGLPVEITAEFETWRRIRDAEGAEGWVLHSLLSGRRTALVAPWSKGGPVSLYQKPNATSAVEAQLQPGVLGSVRSCDGAWCRISGTGSTASCSSRRCGASIRTRRSTEAGRTARSALKRSAWGAAAPRRRRARFRGPPAGAGGARRRLPRRGCRRGRSRPR